MICVSFGKNGGDLVLFRDDFLRKEWAMEDKDSSLTAFADYSFQIRLAKCFVAGA